MERVRLCAVWPTENWLGSSMNHIQGWMTVWECCCPDKENGCLSTTTTRVKILEVIWQARASPTVVPVREGEGEGDENPIHLLLRSFAILFVRQSHFLHFLHREGERGTVPHWLQCSGFTAEFALSLISFLLRISNIYTVFSYKVKTRLRELAPRVRGSQDAASRNLFFTV